MKVRVRRSRLKKQRVSGFLKRTRTRKGRKVLARRRAKGKHALAAIKKK